MMRLLLGHKAVSYTHLLNKKAKQIIERYEIHSCTDVTGFGLAGHSVEMADGSGVTLVIHTAKLPVQKAAFEYAGMGLVPEGAYRNRSFAGDRAVSYTHLAKMSRSKYV